VDAIEPRVMGTETLVKGQAPVASSFLRRIFKGPIIAAGSFDREGADLVAFGRWFSSNPGLPERFGHGHPLTHYVREVFRGGDERAYIDFPAFAP
jgi:N-ethylmaleimide reductase